MKPRQKFAQVISGNESALDLRLQQGTVAVRTIRSPDKSKDNEDAALVVATRSDSLVLGVADGVGGAPGGRFAANTVLQEILSETEHAQAGAGDLRPQVLDAIESANKILLQQGRGSATTIVAAEINDRLLRCFHAGDSELLVVGQRGKVKSRVVPHSPTGYALHAGLLHEDDAVVHEERHLILNVVGASDMRIEVAAPIPLALRDTVLLATDGVFDNLYLDEVVKIVRCGPLADAADSLSALARARMAGDEGERLSKPDDLTLVLYRPC